MLCALVIAVPASLMFAILVGAVLAVIVAACWLGDR